MKKYIGVKIVEAEPMNRKDYNDLRGWELPSDENGDDPGFFKDDGHGHVQWDPSPTFNRDFRPCDAMTFGLAVEAMKAGRKIARTGWNGKGMFVVYQKGCPDGIQCNQQTAEAWGMKEGDLFRCEPYLQIQMVNGSHSMWVPSVNDVLAEDWGVVE